MIAPNKSINNLNKDKKANPDDPKTKELGVAECDIRNQEWMGGGEREEGGREGRGEAGKDDT